MGAYRPIVARGDLLLFVRQSAQERILVTLNLGDEPTTVSFPGRSLEGAVLISSFGDRDGENVAGSIDLRPNEGFVIRLAASTEIPGAV
jgi:alpha-glucosidase